jgi:hypothetical protein
MSQRLNAILPDGVFERFLRLSEQEKRTKSQMAAILIEEAIIARERDASKKQAEVA